MKAKAGESKKPRREVTDYDSHDTSTMIDRHHPLGLDDLGLKLPKVPPSQGISTRLPSELLNQIKALASARDVPHQALIKLLLAESLQRRRAAKRNPAHRDWGVRRDAS